jgi:acyl carrier protein
MNEELIFPRVQQIIAETLGVEVAKVQPRSRIKDDLGADSMQVVTIIIALDAEFDTEFNTDEIPKSGVTVQWIAEFVSRTMAPKN